MLEDPGDRKAALPLPKTACNPVGPSDHFVMFKQGIRQIDSLRVGHRSSGAEIR